MEQCGIIEKSYSEWSSPIVLVRKKDNSTIIDRLGKATFISTLDLRRGYWQLPVAPSDQHKTAFATPFGLYQFKVVASVLNGAPAPFQWMMDRVIDGQREFAAPYLDDLVVFSTTWEEHLKKYSPD